MLNSTIHKERKKRDPASRQSMEIIRLQAVKQILAGERSSDVVRDLGIHRSSLCRWMKSYYKFGPKGLKAKPITGRSTKATIKNRPRKQAKPAVAPRSEIETLVLSLNQSLLDPQQPSLFSFFTTLNTHLHSSVIMLSMNLHSPDSVTASLPKENFHLEDVIELNEKRRSAWHSNPFLAVMDKPGEIFTLRKIIHRKELLKTPFYQQVLAPQGIGDMLALSFHGPDQMLCGLFIGKPTHKRITDKDKQLLLALWPHLETGISTHIALRRYIFTTKALIEATDHLNIATFILDGQGDVVETSDNAKQMLDNKQHLTLKNHRINFPNTDHQKQLEHAITKSIAWRREPRGNKPVEGLRFDDKQGHLGILIQPITPLTMTIPYATEINPHVVVYISSPTQPRLATELNTESQLIGQLFSLTARESRLTILLASGSSLNEAAQLMGITKPSARTYLQRIYEKMGVNRQAELVQVVMKSVALLA